MHCSNNNQSEQKNKGMVKHGLLMFLCCLSPILLLAGLPLFGIKGAALSSLAFLLCPIMHIGMMFMMRKSHNKEDSCHGGSTKKYVDLEKKEYIEADKKEYKVFDTNQ